jgi:hypothetical protein
MIQQARTLSVVSFENNYNKIIIIISLLFTSNIAKLEVNVKVSHS